MTSTRLLQVLTGGALAMLLAACGGDRSADVTAETQPAVATGVASDLTAAPVEAIAPARPIVSERLPYAEVGNELIYGYFTFPEDMVEPLPAVIMIHEWWGLNDVVRATADRLAGEGYIVLAVDLFGGSKASSLEQARQQMLKVVENPQQADDNLRQAYSFVRQVAGAPRIGSLGWGFGGDWSLNFAQLFPAELDAVVIYYGQVTDDEDMLQPIDAPILGLFGAKDPSIPVATVRAFETALERLRKNYTVHVYPQGVHAFANPAGTAYQPGIAEDAWSRTLEFLDLHLAIEASVAP